MSGLAETAVDVGRRQMTPYTGRAIVGSVTLDVVIDDLDAHDWSAELGRDLPTDRATFWVSLVDGPRAGERSLASLEMRLPSREVVVVGSRAFAPPPSAEVPEPSSSDPTTLT